MVAEKREAAKRITAELFKRFTVRVHRDKEGWGMAKYLQKDVEDCVMEILKETRDAEEE